MHTSIDRIVSYKPQAAYLTHFSQVQHVAGLADTMHHHIDAFTAIARACPAEPDAQYAALCMKLRDYLLQQVQEHGCALGPKEAAAILQKDIELNAQGLQVWLQQQHKS